MPELPEIETIRRDLDGVLHGHHIVFLEICDRRLVSAEKEDFLYKTLAGQNWERFDRRGKYLTVRLANGWQLIFHLRMTGQLVLIKNDKVSSSPTPQYRMRMDFDHGVSLALYDQRRFAEVFLVEPKQEWPSIQKLGPDPIHELSRDMFISMIRKRTTRIQPLLMDQHILAGVGNIYAQEALFRAAIRPSRPAHRVSKKEAERLYDALRETLITAIEHRGSSSRNYRDAFGQEGTAQRLHAVYRKGGEPCRRCHTPLRATRIGGRGTVFCPRCQR